MPARYCLFVLLFPGLYFRCMQSFPAMGTESPAGLDYPIAPWTVTFQAMATFGTAQKRLLYFAAAPRALFFSVVSSSQEKDDNRDGQQGEHQKQEHGPWKKCSGATEPAAMTKT